MNITNASSNDDTFDHSLCRNETQSQQKEEPLLIKVRGKNNISLSLLSYLLVVTLENIYLLKKTLENIYINFALNT